MKSFGVSGSYAGWAALGVALLWTLIALLTWGDLVNGPRVSSPFSTFGYGQAALFSGSVSLVHVLGLLLWNGMAALLGYALVIRPIWGAKGYAGAATMLLAGAVPGMLLVGAASRVVTLFAPNAVAAPIIALIVLAASAWVGFRLLPTWRASRQPRWCFFAVLVGIVVAGLVFQIHIDRGHAVAEGSIWFINTVFLSERFGVGANGMFPLITQHYDEAAFILAPIYLLVSPGADASASLTLIYWITLAISRVGLVALTYVAVRGLSVDRFSALACTAFVCAASLSLNPFSSRLLFDSLSPLLYTLHASRFLAAVAPLLIVSALAQGLWRIDAKAVVTAIMLGLGLAAMPAHLVILAPWALALLLLVTLSPAMGVDRASWRAGATMAAAILSAVALVYLGSGVPDVLRAGVLASIGVICGLFMLWRLVAQGVHWSAETARALALGLILVAAFAAGFVLLGNVALGSLWPSLSEIWPYSALETLSRLDGQVVAPSVQIAASPACASGYEWGYRTLTGHCGSLPMFVRTYGLAFVLLAGAIGWGALRTAPVAEARTETTLLWAMLLCLFALPVAFVGFDFITPVVDADTNNWSTWLRSRLVEPWFVSGIALSLVYLLRGLSDRARIALALALLGAATIHVLNPLLLPAQWVANVAYWVAALLP